MVLAVLISAAGFAKAEAAQWFGSASLLDEKSWSLGGYYERSETEPVIKISGVNLFSAQTICVDRFESKISPRGEKRKEYRSQTTKWHFESNTKKGLNHSTVKKMTTYSYTSDHNCPLSNRTRTPTSSPTVYHALNLEDSQQT